MLHARLARVVFGAHDPKTAPAARAGCRRRPQTHHTSVTGGVLAETCGDLLRRFFRERRSKESKA